MDLKTKQLTPFRFRDIGPLTLLTNEVGDFLGNWHVTKYVKIWAIHDSYATVFIDSVYIDFDSGADVTIQIEWATPN